MTKVSENMKRAIGVSRRPGSTQWQWGIKAPKDLQHLYSSPWAFRCSLGTSDLQTANEKAARLHAEWLARFAEQRRMENPQTVEAITPELAAILAGRIYANLLASDDTLRDEPKRLQAMARDLYAVTWGTMANRLSIGKATEPAYLSQHLGPLDGIPESLLDDLAGLNSAAEAEASKAIAGQQLAKALPLLQAQAKALGLTLDANTKGIREALKEALKAIKKAREDISQRDAGAIIETPSAPTPKPRQRAVKAVTLRDVFLRWKAAKKRSEDSVNTCDRSLKIFEDTQGQPAIEAITRAMGDAFRAHLLGLDWSSKTKHDRMTWVKSLLKYACRDLELIPRNPWEGLEIEHKTEKRRAPWTLEQMRAFFGMPLFQSYDLPATWRAGKDAAYWIPLLGLYTGARIGELCQLRVEDIDSDQSGAFIRISEEADGAKVKTEAGLRSVPVHSELVRLGFLEYVEATRKTGAVSLWPAMRFREGKPGGYFSDWFGSFRKTCPIEIPDFHSLRHTVRTAMTEARIAEAVQDRITGHEVRGSTGTRVYAHPKAVLREAVEAIAHHGFNPPKVYAMM